MDYTSGVMPLTRVHKPPFTIEAPGYQKVPGETIPRRHPRAKNGLLNKPADDVHTVFDIVRRSARVYPNHHAVGSRKLVKLHRDVKKIKKNVDGKVQDVDKEWQFFELTAFSFLTYKEYETLVLQLGSGLRKIGLTSDNKLHIFATTRSARCPLRAPCPLLLTETPGPQRAMDLHVPRLRLPVHLHRHRLRHPRRERR